MSLFFSALCWVAFGLLTYGSQHEAVLFGAGILAGAFAMDYLHTTRSRQ